MAATSTDQNRFRKATGHTRFFFLLSVVMLVVVFLGFAPTYYLDRFFDTPIEFQPMPGYLTIHAFILTAWFVGQVLQSGLVQAGHHRMHRKIGVVAAVLAAGVVVTGILVTIYAIPRAEDFGITPPARLNVLVVSNTLNLLVFTTLVSIALRNRFKPHYHKRLMLIASIAILGPAVSPFRALGQFLGSLLPDWASLPVPLIFWLLLVASIVVYDLLTIGRIHRATLWGGGMKAGATAATILSVNTGLAASYVNWIESWLP